MNEDIFELKMQGYCCSQIIMALGLKKLDRENPDLIRSMAGLCNGMWHDGVCGILSAAVCLLFLADEEGYVDRHVQELNEWFEDAFGGMDCQDLLAGNPLNRAEKCPFMLDATFKKVSEMLDWE